MPRDINQQVMELYETMCRDFEIFPTGSRLPSYRKLLARHGCSRQTLNKAIRLLSENGLVRLEDRHGMFAVHKRNRGFRQIVFLRVDWVCEHAEKFSQAIRSEMDKRQNYRYIEIRYSPDRIGHYLEQLRDNTADAIVLWLESVTPEMIQQLSTLNAHVVFFDCGLMLDHLNILDIQEETMGMLAADHLLKKGHRKIALLITEPKGLTCKKKMNGFMDYLRLHGVEPHIIDCNIQHGEASQSMTRDFLIHYFKTHRIDFSACFMMSDYSALGAMKVFQDLGLRIPQDISIVGCQGEMAGESSNPPLTTIVLNSEKVAQSLARGLDELFAGSQFGIRKIPPELVERHSVGSI